MIKKGSEISASVREDVDVCIIGSGAGGSSVARDLAERGHSVVVLEEGSAFYRKDYTGRVKEAMVNMYRNLGMDASAGIPSVLVPTGKCLGGTTVVNMGTCFRAPDKVLEGWRDSGLSEWGPEDMAPYYDRVEEEMSVQAVKPEVMGRNGEILAEGAARLGLHPKPIRRNVTDACKGCGNCAYGCTEDAKQAMHISAIPAADKAGAVFYCDTLAQRLVLEGDRVTGVHGIIRDPETGSYLHSVDVSARVVVLSAGALHTPAFLLQNNLANRSGQVGKHLKLHLCARCVGLFDELIDAQHGVCQNLYIDDYIDQGIMFEATFTGPGSQIPGLIGVGKNYWELCKQYRHMASLGIMISEKSEAKVRADKDGNPIMSLNIVKEDVETLHKAMIIAARIMFAAGAKKVVNGNLAVPEFNSAAELDIASRGKTKASDFMLMAFHPQGSCRMGTDPKKSVVGPDGQTHDIKDLYIADASVFPTSLGVNPQETIWAVSARIAEKIAKKLDSK